MMCRPTALITPAVTEGSGLDIRLPKGFPMATVHSPIRRPWEVPRGATDRLSASIFRTATSVTLSAPTNSASKSRPSGRVTIIRSAPLTTWSFVMMWPSSSMTNPEPRPGTLRAAPGGRKNSSHRDRGLIRAARMTFTLTTEGATLSEARTMAVMRLWVSSWGE